MPHFVELSADAYGNRAYTNSKPCVVEGEITGIGRNAELHFHAPAEIKEKWPSVRLHSHGGWLEVQGPARFLSYEEREQIIQSTERKA